VRALIAAAVVAIVAIIAYLAWDRAGQDADDAPAVSADSDTPAAEPADPAADEADAGEPVPPSFDIVRISPEGTAVIAGRAEPGAEVQVLEGDTVIAEATADARGEWAVIAEVAIEPGTRELALSEVTVEGETIESDSVVVLAVPERQEDENEDETTAEPDVLAVLVPKDDIGGIAVLQAPDSGVGIVGGQGLTLDTVEYDDAGRFALGGRAKPGSHIAVYLNNSLVGDATAGNDGEWRVVPESIVEPGLHTLRVDLVDDEGAVIARLETPFSRAAFILPTGRDSVVIVQPGNSLWRIARRKYGRGLQYVTIFEANRDQIGDPDLIYPGQIFLVPSVN
jgi:nucleoid-associated protein YgaU